tara:strand:+ start:913 stop:1029 length:117 start_codon:yes stop_codon:yes gene_type:complete
VESPQYDRIFQRCKSAILPAQSAGEEALMPLGTISGVE